MKTNQLDEPGSAARRNVLPCVRNTATRLVTLGAHIAGSVLAAACNWALVETWSEGERSERGQYHDAHFGS